ncbi:hypothetical protein HanIR_Chr07g0329291 [Helianthus annuus]|nr:hypothetical protein HanIR_Chr07g0329291 [Helianthus annuus]
MQQYKKLIYTYILGRGLIYSKKTYGIYIKSYNRLAHRVRKATAYALFTLIINHIAFVRFMLFKTKILCMSCVVSIPKHGYAKGKNILSITKTLNQSHLSQLLCALLETRLLLLHIL